MRTVSELAPQHLRGCASFARKENGAYRAVRIAVVCEQPLPTYYRQAWLPQGLRLTVWNVRDIARWPVVE